MTGLPHPPYPLHPPYPRYLRYLRYLPTLPLAHSPRSGYQSPSCHQTETP
jgi:hypothetical protein